MIADWFERPELPWEWELARRTAFMRAIEQLPGAIELCELELERKALFLWKQVRTARQNGRNCNRTASQKTSDDELRKLADLTAKLAAHIERLHEPAITALADEGFLALAFAEKLRELEQVSKFAFGIVEGVEVRGRKPDIVAADVSDAAGRMYQQITGKFPTLTTDPLTGSVSGTWPDFLQAVFEVSNVKASVAAQSRVVSEKMREK